MQNHFGKGSRTTKQRLGRSVRVAMLAGVALASPGLAHPGGSADFAAAAAAAFTEADADGSGTLTAAEFGTYDDLLRQKLEARRFTKLDADGDGALTQEELAAGRPMGRGGGRFGPGF